LCYWHNGQQVFKLTGVRPNRILMEEFDGYYDPDLHAPYGGTQSGTLEQQTPLNSFPSTSGYYSFVLSGVTAQNQSAFYGGIINVGTGAFQMDRSIAGVVDSVSDTAHFFPDSGDSNRGTVVMGTYIYGYFAVDSANWILIATAAQTDLGSGRVYRQPSTAAQPSGSFAFVGVGRQPTPAGSVPTAQGGFFQCDSSGNLTGLLDSNINGTFSSGQVTGSCSIVSNGTNQGRGTLTMNSRNYAFYSTATHGMQMLQLDSDNPGIATALPQSAAGASATAATFSGNYVVQVQSLGKIDSTGVGASYDLLGTVNADGNSALDGTVALDRFDEIARLFWTQTPKAALSGNFSVGPAGRFTGTFSVAPLGTTRQILYVVDGSTMLTLGTDSIPSGGSLELQTF
jgi:hypothetical protein